jgi:hypothetical protein
MTANMMHLLPSTFRFQLSSGKTILSAVFRVKLESAMRVQVRRKEIGPRLAPETVDADTAGTRDGVAYQSLYRADHQGGQRNLPEGLFVLLEIKRSADMMTGFCDLVTHHFYKTS